MIMPRPESKTLGYLYDRYIGDDPERIASYEEALSNAELAVAIYELRTEAGLSQRALAERVGTTASVICRLEDAEYEGHSLSMLKRVAAALGRRVEISFPRALTSTNAKTSPRGEEVVIGPDVKIEVVKVSPRGEEVVIGADAVVQLVKVSRRGSAGTQSEPDTVRFIVADSAGGRLAKKSLKGAAPKKPRKPRGAPS
jgi:transcriptional regulator with XRE-family HTH domain